MLPCQWWDAIIHALHIQSWESMWFIIFLLSDVTRWCRVLYGTYSLTLML